MKVIDLLIGVSFALVETPVITTCSAVAAPGEVIVTPASMDGIYVGALLVAGYHTANEEIVQVLDQTATTFTATFANAHAAGAMLLGATFPSGQPGVPLFTQAELLQYLAETQNDFLLRVRCAFTVDPGVTYDSGKRFYDQPNEAIRLERIAVANKPLFNDSQTDLDNGDYHWMRKTALAPSRWFQDKINIARYGFAPLPTVGGTCELWYSNRAAATLATTDELLVPFPMCHYLKYGVLARCFSKDSENRDPARAAYCEQRYKFGINVALRFVGGLQAATTPNVGAGLKVSPLRSTAPQFEERESLAPAAQAEG